MAGRRPGGRSGCRAGRVRGCGRRGSTHSRGPRAGAWRARSVPAARRRRSSLDPPRCRRRCARRGARRSPGRSAAPARCPVAFRSSVADLLEPPTGLPRSAGAMPGPVSVSTATTTCPGSRRVATVTDPVEVNLLALERRLMTTCSRRCRSPRTVGRSGSRSSRSGRSFSSNSGSTVALTWRTRASTSTSSSRHSTRPASIFARSSRSLMRAVSRSPSVTMMSRFPRTWVMARPVGAVGAGRRGRPARRGAWR